MWRKDGVAHANYVVAAVSHRPASLAETLDQRVARSWERSLAQYKLDPGRTAKPRILTGGPLKDHQQPLESFLAIARHGIGKLHEQVRDAGYVILLTDTSGVTVDCIGDPALDRELKKAGLYLGSWWSEQEEGTNGVGMCLVEQMPVTVHKTEHFRVPNIEFTCTAAPIFGVDGHPLAALDVSALRSPDDKKSQLLVMQLVSLYAILIENANFLKEFRDHWVLKFSRGGEFLEVQAEGILALDNRGTIVAANRSALLELAAGGKGLIRRPIDEVFDLRIEDVPRFAMRAAPFSLRDCAGRKEYFGSVRAPAQPAPGTSSPAHKAQDGRNKVAAAPLLDVLAGTDPQMIRAVDRIKRLLDRDIAILLLGETGTGKEALAKAIHQSSNRAQRPFVALNCAAIPESLIESELFGYRDGAFTGARAKGMRGKLVQSSGGTLFLDEIGDMPLQLQTRLLRVLAEKEVLPLGSEVPVAIDLHVICATHCDLVDAMAQGLFREDLYFRLAGVCLSLPALRDRTDRLQLIRNILHSEAGGALAVPEIDADALAVLLAYPWPGNLRQLRNALRYALAVSEDGRIGLPDLPPEIACTSSTDRAGASRDTLCAPAGAGQGEDLGEKDLLVATLRTHHWEIATSARALKISRATLYRKMKKFNIIPPNLLF